MEYITLNNDIKMPILGFGTYFPEAKDTRAAVYNALINGYRHLDTAKWYVNESEVAKAIQDSGVKREDLFITCKVESKGYIDTMNDIYDSLNKFNTTYFDLILIHWPAGNILDSYKALEDMYDRKIAKSIGLSNFNEEYCNYIVNNCRIKPQVNQIETHLYFQEKKMEKYLKDNNIILESWSPLAEGALNLIEDKTLIDISKKYNKTPVQIALRFLVQKGIVTIPRSTNIDHIKENIDIFDFNIDDKDIKVLEGLDKKKQLSGWPSIMKSETLY